MSHSPSRLSIIASGFYIYELSASETLNVLLGVGYFSGLPINAVIKLVDTSGNKSPLLTNNFTLTIDATGTASVAGTQASSSSSSLGGYIIPNVVGDGTTDDAAAIQAAINTAVAAGGGTVLLPPATMAVATPLVLNGNGVILQGYSSTKTRIVTIGNATRALRVGSLSTSSTGKSTDCGVLNIGFEARSAATVEGVEIYGVTRLLVQHCDFLRGTAALTVRNADQCTFLHNQYRANTTNGVALRLLQGTVDDVTTCSFIGGIADARGTNGLCLELGDGSGGTPNEFNNIVLQGIKFDGNNIAGVTGIRGIAGCRNLTINNCEFKELRGYGIDYVTGLLDAEKVYFDLDACKMLGNSTNPSLAHVYVKQPSASGSRTIITINNTQLHRAVSAVVGASGSPYISLNHVDCSNLTNFLEIETGATPAFVVGMNNLGSSVTNQQGTILAAASLTITSLAERARGTWAS